MSPEWQAMAPHRLPYFMPWTMAPYPPEDLPKTARWAGPGRMRKRDSSAGTISSSRKSAQFPVDLELMYWFPPMAVKQSGNAAMTGPMSPERTSRSIRCGTVSP